MTCHDCLRNLVDIHNAQRTALAECDDVQAAIESDRMSAQIAQMILCQRQIDRELQG